MKTLQFWDRGFMTLSQKHEERVWKLPFLILKQNLNVYMERYLL